MLFNFVVSVLFLLRVFLDVDGLSRGNLRRGHDKNCTLQEVNEATIEAAGCYGGKFRDLYIEVNNLFVKSSPRATQYGVVGKALGLSKQENLTKIELKLLTDVIHYDVNKKTLLRGSSTRGNKSNHVKRKDIVALGSDILRSENIRELNELKKQFPVAERLLKDFEKFSAKTASTLNENSYISKAENIEFTAASLSRHDLSVDFIFRPNNSTINGTKKFLEDQDSIRLPKDAILQNGTSYAVSTFYFKTLQNILPSTNNIRKDHNSSNETGFINSRIISLSIFGGSNIRFRKPVEITLRHMKKASKYEHKGVFWNFTDNYNGHWSDAGCEITRQTSTATAFKCNHLTNFAILVTGKLKPTSTSAKEYAALSAISNVGCFLSMIGEIATLAVYALTKVQSKRRFILINTVLCLVLAQAIFLAGVEQAKDNKALCAFIAALICYFFLASFLWMLNMGIHLYLLTSKIFKTHYPFWYFMISGYGVPLAEILLAAAITQGKGFGTTKFCWLSNENGAVWIFLLPVSMIVMVNICITVTVLLRILHTKKMQDTKTAAKIKHAIRAVLLLTPSLGLTWIFGIFTIASDDVILHYIFAVLNSLQGVFIFTNCCLLDKKVRQEISGLIRHPGRLSSRDTPLRKIMPVQEYSSTSANKESTKTH